MKLKVTGLETLALEDPSGVCQSKPTISPWAVRQVPRPRISGPPTNWTGGHLPLSGNWTKGLTNTTGENLTHRTGNITEGKSAWM